MQIPDITLEEGCPIRRSPGLGYFHLPRRIAGSRVLHRLLVPRHPPYALSNLTKKIYYTDSKCARYKYTYLLYGSVKLIFNLSFYSFNLSKNNFKDCGAKRNRTDNLRLARAALSQLSYSPKFLLGVIQIGQAPISGPE
jgi:hypothetical protein